MNHRSRHPLFSVVAVISLALLGATSAGASLVGVRISSVTEDDATGEVTFDLTVFDTNNPGQAVLGDLLDRTLANTYTTILPDNYGLGSVNYRVVLGSRSDWNTFPHPAINFGDGDTMPMATLALQGQTTVSGSSLFAYRLGALSHTYDDGTFMLRATVGPDGGPLPGLGRATTVNVATGYPLTGTLVNDFSVFRIVYPTSALATPVYSYAGNSPFSYPATLRYITARQDVTISMGPPPGPGDSLDVPTLGTWSLLLLSGLLAGAGLILLRRSH
ncbi:MAG: IPTL-CTERM sorting domain-containing protein [Acidobacteriota bacterium]